MTQENPKCPKCNSIHAYPDGNLWICPECFHEWVPSLAEVNEETDEVLESVDGQLPSFLDANGVKLESGDTVATIKDLKVGGDTLKSGTKVKNIRLLDVPVNGHDISCKVDGHGSIYLKCSVSLGVSKALRS